MKSFKTFIAEEKNTHMMHAEDTVLYGGVDGVRQAIFALRSLRDMLKGSHTGKEKLSTKWGGAPAVFAGIDPRDQQFFVAKKGIFNKNPKVYKTPAEVDADTSGDLADKLKLALKYLPELDIRGVIQGDFLYSSSDLKTEKIDGESYLTFHPNTIVYAVPVNSDLAKQIRKSKIGIVWHTSYNGTSFEDMKASYGVNVAGLSPSTNVWSQDAMIRDMSNLTLTQKETEEINKQLSDIGRLFQKISGSTLRELEKNQQLAQMIETFNNTYVRKGEQIRDTRKHADNLIAYINDKFEKEAEKRKTEKGKATQYQKRDDLLKFFSPSNKRNLIMMFDLQNKLVDAKLKLISKLNKYNQTSTFLKTKDGYEVTGQEGYVAIDKMGGNALKLVDRMGFSYANFDPNIIKGWQR